MSVSRAVSDSGEGGRAPELTALGVLASEIGGHRVFLEWLGHFHGYPICG
jgi:hypothetical protein